MTGAGGGPRSGGLSRNNGHGSSTSWSKPAGSNNSNSGSQQSRQSKGSGTIGSTSERPYIDIARSMLAAAQAAMHNATSHSNPVASTGKSNTTNTGGNIPLFINFFFPISIKGIRQSGIKLM